MPDSVSPIAVTPIGVIRTPYTDKYTAPRQPGLGGKGVMGKIVLLPGLNFEQALQDLEGFERIWIISWFDRNFTWKPLVLPPRGTRVRRGVFATRSPHRPNPIGLSLCKLKGIRKRTLIVEDPDLLDRTPVLDIKPYIPYAEAFADSAVGWLAEAAAGTIRRVVVSDMVALQASWLASKFGVHLLDHAMTVLSRDPWPHPYKRTSEIARGEYQLALKSWRIRYLIEPHQIVLLQIQSGYPPAALKNQEKSSLHDVEAHIAFQAHWPQLAHIL